VGGKTRGTGNRVLQVDYTYADDVLFVHVSSPDDDNDVDSDHAGDRAEHRHALEELLGRKDRVEVDRVGRDVHVAAERRQVSTETLCPRVGRQWPHLPTVTRTVIQ